MTEYFLAKDLSTLFKEVLNVHEENSIEEKIQVYKNQCFPST
jgi:hypothetical protein